MPSLNRVQLIGRLGKDPENRSTPKGNTYTTFSLAVDRRWKDKTGETHQIPIGSMWKPGGNWARFAVIFFPKENWFIWKEGCAPVVMNTRATRAISPRCC